MNILGLILSIYLLSVNVNAFQTPTSDQELIVRQMIRSWCPSLTDHLLRLEHFSVQSDKDGFVTQLSLSGGCPVNFYQMKVLLDPNDPLGFRITHYTGASSGNYQRDIAQNILTFHDFLYLNSYHSFYAVKFLEYTNNIRSSLDSCSVNIQGASLVYCWYPDSTSTVYLTDLGLIQDIQADSRGLDNLIQVLTQVANDFFEPVTIWVRPPILGDPFGYTRLVKRLSSENVQCIMAEATCSSVQLADYLSQKLGLAWHHDNRIGGLHDCQLTDFPRFEERYPIDRAWIDQPVRFPKTCQRPLVIASEITIRNLIYIGDSLPPGTILVSRKGSKLWPLTIDYGQTPQSLKTRQIFGKDADCSSDPWYDSFF